MVQQNVDISQEHREKAFSVTIRTPAGIPGEFHVRSDESVAHVAKIAVDHFVAHKQLEPGPYGLALIRDGKATDMLDSARLEDYSVVAGDVLALISKEPQADG